MFSWHTILNVIAPLPLAAYLVWRYRAHMSGNGVVITLVVLLSIGQAHPSIQALFFMVGASGEQEYHTHAIAFFPLLFLVLGKFHTPSPAVFYAGTYLGLLATDIADLVFRWSNDKGILPLGLYFDAIGGGGWWDGLLHLPLLAMLLAWFATKELARGKRYRWMLRYQPSIQSAADDVFRINA